MGRAGAGRGGQWEPVLHRSWAPLPREHLGQFWKDQLRPWPLSIHKDVHASQRPPQGPALSTRRVFSVCEGVLTSSQEMQSTKKLRMDFQRCCTKINLP